MKKVYLCFAILASLFLSACSSAPNGNASGSGVYEDVRFIFCDNLSEYRAFVTEGYKTQGYPGCTQLPDNFVTWEQASVFGEVESFGLSLDHTHGNYCIRDANGAVLTLYVDFLDGKGSKPDLSLEKSRIQVDLTRAEGSMRKVAKNSSRMKILRDEFEYVYIPNGKLLSIRWHSNGVQFILSGDLYDYTVTKEASIVSYLLAIPDETAEIAFSQIRQAFS